jgi:urease accessory protein
MRGASNRAVSMNATLLLLADSRFPTGAHAHSAGLEASFARGDVTTVDDVRSFIEGRLATSAFTDAAFTAAACAAAMPLTVLDTELAARMPSARLRTVGRSLGRQLLRAAERAWPSAIYGDVRAVHADGPLQPIALGVVASAAGLGASQAALCSLHHLVGAVTTAAVRLAGFDPFEVHALAARLAPRLEAVAGAAAADALTGRLPSATSLLADVLAEHHATWEVRLVAS